MSVTEDAVQGVQVGLLDTAYSVLERMTDIGALGPDILPVTTLWNLKAVVLRKLGEFHIASRLFRGHSILLVIDVGEPFEKQKWENVCLEIGRINRAAQDIGRLPEMPEEGPDIQID